MCYNRCGEFMNGIVLVNKPSGYTSRDVVNIIGKKLETKKIGHTGTLDPMATGVMVLCVGTATKLVEIITSEKKEYIAQIILGLKTDTGDITGNVLEEQNVVFTQEKLDDVCKRMRKTYLQTVPIYSAVKVNGKKLYEYARKGVYVDLPTREVTIYELECIEGPIYENGKTIFTIRALVSKGTYIRSLIEDLAASLETIGTMASLTRTKQGDYRLEECIPIEEVERQSLIEMDSALLKYPVVQVDLFLEKKIRNGCILENRYTEPIILFQNEEGILLALYQRYEKDSTKIKPWKML